MRVWFDPEHAFFEHVDVFEQRGRFELEAGAVEDVEAGQAAEFVFQFVGCLVLVGDGQHFDAPHVAPAVFRVLPDDFVHLDGGLFGDGFVLFAALLLLLFAVAVAVVGLVFGLGPVVASSLGVLVAWSREVDDEVGNRRALSTAEGFAVEQELTDGLGLELVLGVGRAVEDKRELQLRERRVPQFCEVFVLFEEFSDLRGELQDNDVLDKRTQRGRGLPRPHEADLEGARVACLPDRDVESRHFRLETVRRQMRVRSI